MTDQEPAVLVDEETRQRWAELAITTRMIDWVISTVNKPDPDTVFHSLDEDAPEAISQWCREGIRSAIDHLRAWANHAVPLVQYPGQVVHHSGFRWTFTLMRGGLEGAALSLWLSGSTSAPVALARLIRMVRDDRREQILAFAAMGRDTSKIEATLASHELAASQLTAFGPDTKKLPTMIEMLQGAADQAGRPRGTIEAHWRTCSAAAHGKSWAIHELQTQTGEAVEWKPGQYHFTAHPDAARMTEILDDTLHLMSAAMVRYLQRSYSGDIAALTRRASFEAAKMSPQKDGGAHIEAVAREWGLLQDDPDSPDETAEAGAS